MAQPQLALTQPSAAAVAHEQRPLKLLVRLLVRERACCCCRCCQALWTQLLEVQHVAAAQLQMAMRARLQHCQLWWWWWWCCCQGRAEVAPCCSRHCAAREAAGQRQHR